MSSVKRERLPTCIAYVPVRHVGNLSHGRITIQAHRCTYQAHALASHGVTLCHVHAGKRQRRRRRRSDNLDMFDDQPGAAQPDDGPSRSAGSDGVPF